MKNAVFFLCQIALAKAFVVPRATVAGPASSLFAKKQSDEIPTEEVDVVVIGSGLAGLSCAALLSHCDKKIVVLEAHDTPGGAVRPIGVFCFSRRICVTLFPLSSKPCFH
jgi:heterodisulfide reductase subunit A-like polyferredoxin